MHAQYASCPRYSTSGAASAVERVSDRHEDDLGGTLRPFGETRVQRVRVVLEPSTADLPAVQHTAWMLLNLIARMDGVVGHVGLVCPSGVPVRGRVVPLAQDHAHLEDALFAGARHIDAVPVERDFDGERTFVVGPGANVDGAVRVYGEGWCGAIADADLDRGFVSELPFGPYIAACLAAGELFKAARVRDNEPVSVAGYSAWSLTGSSRPFSDGPSRLTDVVLDASLAGVGAVGCAAVHALWASPELRGDVDLIATTNVDSI